MDIYKICAPEGSECMMSSVNPVDIIDDGKGGGGKFLFTKVDVDTTKTKDASPII